MEDSYKYATPNTQKKSLQLFLKNKTPIETPSAIRYGRKALTKREMNLFKEAKKGSHHEEKENSGIKVLNDSIVNDQTYANITPFDISDQLNISNATSLKPNIRYEIRNKKSKYMQPINAAPLDLHSTAENETYSISLLGTISEEDDLDKVKSKIKQLHNRKRKFNKEIIFDANNIAISSTSALALSSDEEDLEREKSKIKQLRKRKKSNFLNVKTTKLNLNKFENVGQLDLNQSKSIVQQLEKAKITASEDSDKMDSSFNSVDKTYQSLLDKNSSELSDEKEMDRPNVKTKIINLHKKSFRTVAKTNNNTYLQNFSDTKDNSELTSDLSSRSEPETVKKFTVSRKAFKINIDSIVHQIIETDERNKSEDENDRVSFRDKIGPDLNINNNKESNDVEIGMMKDVSRSGNQPTHLQPAEVSKFNLTSNQNTLLKDNANNSAESSSPNSLISNDSNNDFGLFENIKNKHKKIIFQQKPVEINLNSVIHQFIETDENGEINDGKFGSSSTHSSAKIDESGSNINSNYVDNAEGSLPIIETSSPRRSSRILASTPSYFENESNVKRGNNAIIVNSAIASTNVTSYSESTEHAQSPRKKFASSPPSVKSRISLEVPPTSPNISNITNNSSSSSVSPAKIAVSGSTLGTKNDIHHFIASDENDKNSNKIFGSSSTHSPAKIVGSSSNISRNFVGNAGGSLPIIEMSSPRRSSRILASRSSYIENKSLVNIAISSPNTSYSEPTEHAQSPIPIQKYISSPKRGKSSISLEIAPTNPNSPDSVEIFQKNSTIPNITNNSISSSISPSKTTVSDFSLKSKNVDNTGDSSHIVEMSFARGSNKSFVSKLSHIENENNYQSKINSSHFQPTESSKYNLTSNQNTPLKDFANNLSVEFSSPNSLISNDSNNELVGNVKNKNKKIIFQQKPVEINLNSVIEQFNEIDENDKISDGNIGISLSLSPKKIYRHKSGSNIGNNYVDNTKDSSSIIERSPPRQSSKNLVSVQSHAEIGSNVKRVTNESTANIVTSDSESSHTLEIVLTNPTSTDSIFSAIDNGLDSPSKNLRSSRSYSNNFSNYSNFNNSGSPLLTSTKNNFDGFSKSGKETSPAENAGDAIIVNTNLIHQGKSVVQNLKFPIENAKPSVLTSSRHQESGSPLSSRNPNSNKYIASGEASSNISLDETGNDFNSISPDNNNEQPTSTNIFRKSMDKTTFIQSLNNKSIGAQTSHSNQKFLPQAHVVMADSHHETINSPIINGKSKDNLKQLTMKEFLARLSKGNLPPTPVKDKPLTSLISSYASKTVDKSNKPIVKRSYSQKTKSKTVNTSIPQSINKKIFQHFTRHIVTKEAMHVVQQASEKFFEQFMNDILNILRMKTRTITSKHIYFLIKRLKLLNTKSELHAMMQELLPSNEWIKVIPIMLPFGQVKPSKDVND